MPSFDELYINELPREQKETPFVAEGSFLQATQASFRALGFKVAHFDEALIQTLSRESLE